MTHFSFQLENSAALLTPQDILHKLDITQESTEATATKIAAPTIVDIDDDDSTLKDQTAELIENLIQQLLDSPAEAMDTIKDILNTVGGTIQNVSYLKVIV